MDAPHGTTSTTQGFTGSKGNILVVDDETGVQKLVSEYLRSLGYTCRACHTGFEALELLSSSRFDAVISDLKMPGMGGLELLHSVRATHRHMGFIMATGTGDVQVGIQSMKDGADDYLLKPLDGDILGITVNRVLEKKLLEMELENYQLNLEEIVQARTRQLQDAMREIELSYGEALDTLSATLDLRDNDTAGHSRRVTTYSLEIAKAMGCNQESLKVIARAALLHDIGKIGIPDAILLKPDRLTAIEREVMETHVRIGYELMGHLPFLAGSAEIVLAHHERFDGKGYPRGMGGEAIPLGARIFAVADTLDAMTSDRPYRKALPYSAAREEISRESGSQFDPAVVLAFLFIPEATWQSIRQGSGVPLSALNWELQDHGSIARPKKRNSNVPTPELRHKASV
jgi:putative nucleotidyltransferase with HDIG domain